MVFYTPKAPKAAVLALLFLLPSPVGVDAPKPEWKPKPLQQPYSYFQKVSRATLNRGLQETPEDVSAPTVAETLPSWKPPLRYERWPVVQNFAGNPAPTSSALAQEQNPHWRGLQRIKEGWVPQTLIPYFQSAPDATQPAASSADSTYAPWKPPVRYERQDVVVRFDSGRGYGDVPAPATPLAAEGHTWSPRPLRQPYSPYRQRYSIQNPAQDMLGGGEVGQFTVMWEYRTQYEERAQRARTFYLQGQDLNGLTVVNVTAFPGFVNKQTAQFQLPKAVWMYWQQNLLLNENAFIEPPTEAIFVNRQTVANPIKFIPGLIFNGATDPETITAGEVPPHFKGKFTPASHTINRGLFTNTENVATTTAEVGTETWDYRITVPQVRFRPTVFNLLKGNLIRGVVLSQPETAHTTFAHAFIMDVSTLSGLALNYVDTALQETGTSIQLEWVQAGNNQDMQLLGYAVRGVPAESAQMDESNTHSSGQFILDASRLEVPTHYTAHVPINERGRSIELEWVQSAADHDVQLLGYAIRGVPSETMSQEQS